MPVSIDPTYKALVAVFMFGGNDAHGTVLPTDAASWNAYIAARGNATNGVGLQPVGTATATTGTMNEKLGGVLPIVPKVLHAGRTFALHPALAPLVPLFDSERLGIVANVGPLLGPTTKQDYTNKVGLPGKLMSHNDQQSTWQSGGAEGATKGWGGLLMDTLLGANSNGIFSATSFNGTAVWPAGRRTVGYQCTSNGPITVGDGTGIYASAEVQKHLKRIMGTAYSGSVLDTEHTAVSARGIAAADMLSAIYPTGSAGVWGSTDNQAADDKLKYTEPGSSPAVKTFNPLAAQLQGVARLIAIQQQLGMQRQIFFVGMGGFDTHSSLQDDHAGLMARVGHALAYFHDTLVGMSAINNVTTFTMSDFGRSLANNGSGVDHGWGGHHFVMGGGVKGGRIYGRFPTYASPDSQGKFNSPDMLDSGMFLPAISVDQYGATLARWLGTSDAAITNAFPNLARWPANVRNLGFML